MTTGGLRKWKSEGCPAKAFTRGPTFEADLVGDVEGSVIPGNSVLGIAAAWSKHFVKCRNTVSRSELGDTWPYSMNKASDVIALVQRSLRPIRRL